MKTYAIITIILSTFLLTACNSEPSDKDIYNVFKSVVDRANASRKAFDSRATPPGRGGVGILRISGQKAREVAEAVLGKLPKPRYANAIWLDVQPGRTTVAQR
jgi:hypothetical protein